MIVYPTKVITGTWRRVILKLSLTVQNRGIEETSMNCNTELFTILLSNFYIQLGFCAYFVRLANKTKGFFVLWRDSFHPFTQCFLLPLLDKRGRVACNKCLIVNSSILDDGF